MKYEVITKVPMQSIIFWDVTRVYEEVLLALSGSKSEQREQASTAFSCAVGSEIVTAVVKNCVGYGTV
jgi:hypothetical protein